MNKHGILNMIYLIPLFHAVTTRFYAGIFVIAKPYHCGALTEWTQYFVPQRTNSGMTRYERFKPPGYHVFQTWRHITTINVHLFLNPHP